MAEEGDYSSSLGSLVDADTGLDLDSFGWLLLFKTLAAIGAGVICFGGALIPTRLVALLKGRGNVLSYANCLGAGILLGASFVHLLTDAEDVEDPDAIELPPYFTHMVAGVGFLLSFALEKVIFGHSHSHAHLPASDGHHHHHRDGENHEHHHNHDVELEELGATTLDDEEPEHAHSHGHGHAHGDDEEAFEAELSEAEHVMEVEEGHGHSHGAEVKEGPKRFPYILFVILGIESVVSGSALGVQETAAKVLVVWLAIITHIWAESFTLCVGVLKSGLSEPVTLGIMALYSTLTPIGIAVGVISMLFLSNAVSEVVSAVLVAFAAGCFLYVATLEIIVEEFEAEKGRLFKLGLLLVGFIFMCVLVLFF